MAVFLPCLLCGEPLDVRTTKSKKPKPYVTCDPCGMQLFIRREQGQDNLKRLLETLRRRSLPLRDHAMTLFRIRAIVQELNGIEEELKKLQGLLGPLSESKTKKRTRDLLRTRQENLLKNLEHLIEAPEPDVAGEE